MSSDLLRHAIPSNIQLRSLSPDAVFCLNKPSATSVSCSLLSTSTVPSWGSATPPGRPRCSLQAAKIVLYTASYLSYSSRSGLCTAERLLRSNSQQLSPGARDSQGDTSQLHIH